MAYTCKKCGKVYYYDVKRCIFCKSDIVKDEGKKLNVDAITEVFVPSVEHKQVPYYDILVQDEKGNFSIIKTSRKYNIGESFESKENEKGSSSLKGIKIGVIGTGITGLGIAEVCLMHGFEVMLVSRTEERLKKIGPEIGRFLMKFMGEAEKDMLMKNYRASANLDELKDYGLIIESVVEDKKTKDSYFKKLDGICKKNAIIATNTSSLSVDELGKNLKDPSRFLGMHFFNPVPRMALLEIVKGSKTSEKTMVFAADFAEAIGKTAVMTKDSPCFIVNRVMAPYLNEAAMLYEKGVASKEDIDRAVKLGLNHPMGPLALMDLIGLDVVLEIMNNLHEATKDGRYMPAEIIKKMVKEGNLGRKSGEGFYKY